jgi:hypothetical protein
LDTINNPVSIAIRIKGISNKNQAISLCPSLHMRLRIHVQKRMYINLTINTTVVFGTFLLNDPKVKTFVLLRFCSITAINPTIDIEKYRNAGVHKSFNFLGKGIMI